MSINLKSSSKRVTRDKIKEEDFKDHEDPKNEFKKEQRECFFDRVDWLCFIFSSILLLISACTTVVLESVKKGLF